MAEPAYPLAFPERDEERIWPEQGSWTYEDYLRLPDDGRSYQVIRGFLYVTPTPTYEHQYSVTELARRAGNFVKKRRLGTVLVAPYDVQLPEGIADPIQPDILFFRRGNQPRPGDRSFLGVPDLVMEVLSPSTRRFDQTVKLPAFRDAGVPEVWFVDSRARTITVYRFDQDRKDYVVVQNAGEGETIASSILPGLRIPVDVVFLPA